VIFALSARQDTLDSVRHRILDLVHDLAPGLQKSPTVGFTGPVDLVVTGALADDVIAVTREALTNAVKHSQADQTGVILDIIDGMVHLMICDNGAGITDTSRRSGLANLEARATERGGSFVITTGPTGTTVDWSVPISNSGPINDSAPINNTGHETVA
jgi:signal transduction histidine kinase